MNWSMSKQIQELALTANPWELKYDEEINCPSYTVGSLIFKLHTKGVGGAFGGLQWPGMSFCKHFWVIWNFGLLKVVSTLALNNIFSSSTACNSLVRFWMKLWYLY